MNDRLLCLGSFAGLLFVVLPAAAAPDPPKLRLPDTVRPTRYALDLHLNPEQERFTGTADVDLEVRAATDVVWLNSAELTVQEAVVQVGSARLPARPTAAANEFLSLQTERPIPVGKARLHLVYTGQASDTEAAGIFRRKDGERWYAMTQFEPVDARRAFPCFDEPSFKIPWQITLHVRRGDVAVSNNPIEASMDQPDGMKTVRFAVTRPLPSYLVAFAAGPFDVVDLGRVGRKRTPVRILTAQGRGAQARVARRTIPGLLMKLEEYFGQAYPYPKLDHLALPINSGFFGAMENAGLITYDERGLIAPPERETLPFERNVAMISAHEMAHHWFGDLVTTAWWDDIWLNEGFASWLEGKLVHRWKPEWDPSDTGRVQSRGWAMGSDRLATARRIREPITSPDDIQNAFDGITYSKGAALLNMVESWLGEETFRKGVRRYLREHAWGNATSADFAGAISAAAGRDVRPVFNTFLEQTGTPLLTVELVQESSKPTRLRLTQSRYLPLGSTARHDQTWQLPVRIRYDDGKGGGHATTLLTGAVTEVPLGSGSRPPRWVVVNEGSAGYFRVLYPRELLARLLSDPDVHLTPAERAGLSGDLNALVRSGDFKIGEALPLLPALLRDADRATVTDTTALIGAAGTVPESLRPALARFIRRTYGERARALGWLPKPGEEAETRFLRFALVPLVASAGEDPELTAEARQLAERWLADHRSIDPDIAPAVLRVAARTGDRALYDRYLAAARQCTDAAERTMLLNTLGAFRSPELAQSSLELVLKEDFAPRDTLGILFSLGGDDRTRPLAYEFARKQFDALLARLPRDAAPGLIRVVGLVPDEMRSAEVEGFFRARAERIPGGPRILAQQLEQLQLAEALKKIQVPSLEQFLNAQE